MGQDFGTGFGSDRANFVSLSDFTHLQEAARDGHECLQLVVGGANGQVIAYELHEEPSPMWIRESERCVHWNWIAIFSYAASLAISLAIWRGVFRVVGHLVK